MLFEKFSPEDVEALCVEPGGASRVAERRLLTVLWGSEPEQLQSPTESAVLIQATLSYITPNKQGSSGSLLENAPSAEVKIAALKHLDLNAVDVHLLAKPETPNVALAILKHPACSITTLLTMLQYTSYSWKGKEGASQMLYVAAGKYGKVAKILESVAILLDESGYAAVVSDAAELSEAQLEIFGTLVADLGGNGIVGTFIDVTLLELVDQAKLVTEKH